MTLGYIRTYVMICIMLLHELPWIMEAAERRDDGEGGGLYIPSCHDCYYCYCKHSNCPSHSKMSSMHSFCKHRGHVNCSQNYDIDGGWSAWQSWGLCTGTCTHGHRTRYRQCSNPAPVNCGHNCHGSIHETDYHCKPAQCLTTVTTSTTRNPAPVFTRCSKLCAVTAVVDERPVLHGNSGICPGGMSGRSEALPLHCCSHVNNNLTHYGIKVMSGCSTFPPYTAVAAIDVNGNLQSDTVGIFVGCLSHPEIGFQLIRQDCQSVPNLVHVNTTQTKYGSPYTYRAVY